ncbi:lantibiotic dehydratase [Micromonospora sp. LOL_024]|uniref:lantibiotic dehydratase n=1 Tax=Micromonospora sp. LOL_024 TaxID=3345412 RepID=UPI003A8B66FB
MIGTTVDGRPPGGAPRRGGTAAAPLGVTVAPYALVRVAGVTLPGPSAEAEEFRVVAAELLSLTERAERVAAPLGDALHAQVALVDPALRRALLALRRDLHNARSPSAALRARLDGWTAPPALASWLALRDDIDRRAGELDALLAPGLAGDRAALAELCRSEELARAVALTSADLLRALRRAAAQGAAPDDRARKSEAAVLRYALRAATKTAPLSWFTRVGWGWWDRATPEATVPPEVVALAQLDRATLTALVDAVLRHPGRRGDLPHLLAPSLRVDGTLVRLRRQVRALDAPPGVLREEAVTLPVNRALRQVLALLRPGDVATPNHLAAALAARLPGAPEQASAAARTYLHALVEQGVLRPAYPADAQAVDGPGEIADWLAGLGLTELAATLREIGDRTADFAGLDSADRPAALAHLRTRWDAAFALVGETRTGRPHPVTEDVTLVRPVRLGREHGRDHRSALAALAPIFEVFDQHAVIRRLARDRFVARYGVGGRCDSVVEFAEEYAQVWQSLRLVGNNGALAPELALPPGHGLRGLAQLRADLVAAVRADEGNLVLPDTLLDTAACRLPDWMTVRASSYAIFGQSDEGGRFCVNHVYGGWGRFTSRFLRSFPAEATAAVATQLRHHLGARVAQLRPVNGFNGNLHPLFVDDEVVDDRRRGSLVPSDLRLVHDVARDQVRLVVAATGDTLDVLYLGFLVPIVLPEHLISLLTDVGPGLVELGGAMVAGRTLRGAVGAVRHRPRLSYGDIVLSRATWRLSADTVTAWRAELDARPTAVGQTAVRWRHLLGLPEHIFVGACAVDGAKGLEAFMSYQEQPRSQYVDLGSPLHLRCLSRTLARYQNGLVVEEAVPVPRPGEPATEVVIELYRGGTHE